MCASPLVFTCVSFISSRGGREDFVVNGFASPPLITICACMVVGFLADKPTPVQDFDTPRMPCVTLEPVIKCLRVV